MIKVIVGTTTSRTTKIYPETTSIRAILEENSIEYGNAQVMLDGVAIGLGDMDKTLGGLGITEKCMLVAVVKAANA